MCPPTFFAVRYRINPWMDPSRPVDRAKAMAEWRAIRYAHLAAGHDVTTVEGVPGLPDMVFAANAGLVGAGRALVSRFHFPQRAPEQEAYQRYFAQLGLEVELADFDNEGQGDYLSAGEVVLAGSGFRSDARGRGQVADFFGREVIGLGLIDPRFYHLDTALAVLRPGLIAYYPNAFSMRSRGLLGDLYPDAIIAGEADAVAFGLNAVSDGRQVVISSGAEGFAAQVRERGLEVISLDTSELQRAGGAVKCVTLEMGGWE